VSDIEGRPIPKKQVKSYMKENMDKINLTLRKTLEKRLEFVKTEIETWFKKELAKKKTGRKYTQIINGTKLTWTASKPDEYPAKRTGDMIAATKVTWSIGPKQARITITVGVPYADILEEDSDTPGPKRPLVGATRRRFEKLIQKAFSKGYSSFREGT